MTLNEEEILGNNAESQSHFIIYDVENDYPFIYAACKEHSRMCLTCAQKAMRHHAGVGNPLDEEGIKIGVSYISQISERANIILEQSQKILIEHQKQIREMSETVARVTELVEINSKTNTEVLTQLKNTIKEDLTRFYKIATIVSIPLIIGASFVIAWISNGIQAV